MFVNFFVVHWAPGGPIDQMLHRMQSKDTENSGVSVNAGVGHSYYQETAEKLKKQYGFDKPLIPRFFYMVKKYVCFDFGRSYFKNENVLKLIADRLPISLSLGLWSTLLIYSLAIPLGILKAVRNGSAFDVCSSLLILIGYAIPTFLFAVILIIFFAGGSFFAWFPLQGLFSYNFSSLSPLQQCADYFWHLALPIMAKVITSLAGLTMMVKNSFLEEIGKQYVITAQAQGFSTKAVLLKHVFQNAMLIIIASLPITLMQVVFSESFLIETIFSLDGLGLMGYEAILNRDYPIIFGSLYIFTLIGLILHLIGDFIYTHIDPRIHFRGLSEQ